MAGWTEKAFRKDCSVTTSGMSVDEFIANQLIILWLCGQHSDPLNAPETLYRDKISDIVTKDRMRKIIEYYSVDYQQIRDSKIKKQIFYSKPFVRTQRNQETLLVSMHLLQMVFANSLYWLERDYYHDNNMGQAFLNAFGGMFEDYFKETDADIFCIRESKLILGLSLILLGVAAAGKPVERLTAQQ